MSGAQKIYGGDAARKYMPPPSEAMIAAMAKAGNDAAAGFITEMTGNSECGSVEAGSESEAMWQTAARAMYAAVALHAGVRPEGVPEPTLKAKPLKGGLE